MSKRRTREMGRPKYPPGMARSVYVAFRVTPSERAELDKAAARDGVKLAEFLRDAVLKAAQEG